MRFVQPAVLLLGVPVYVGAIAALLSPESGHDYSIWCLVIVGAWNLLLTIAAAIAIVDGVRRVQARDTRGLGTSAMVVKLVSIPFFLANFFVLGFTFNAGVVLIWMGPVLWAIDVIGIVLTFLTMLSTSIPAWAAVIQLRRERIIGNGLAALYTLLCLVFVADIAATVMLFGHSRRRPRLTAVWLTVGTGIAMIAVGVLDYFYGFLEALVPELDYYQLGWLDWVVPVGLGIAVIVATVVIGVARRSALRREAPLPGALATS